MAILAGQDAAVAAVQVVTTVASHIISSSVSQSSLPSPSPGSLRKRANSVIIPTLYDTSGASPGTVVASLLGAVAGFIALVWLFSAIQGNIDNKMVSEEVVRREPSHRSRRGSHTEAHRHSHHTHHEHHSHRDRHESRRHSRNERDMERGRIIREETIVPVGTHEVVREKREIREVPAAATPTMTRKYYDLSPRGDEVVEVYEEEATIVNRDKEKDDGKDERKKKRQHRQSKS